MNREEILVPGRPVLSHASDAVRAAGYLFVAGLLPVGGTVRWSEATTWSPRRST